MHVAVSALFQAHGGSLANLKNLLTEWNRMNVHERHRVTVFCSSQVERELSSSIKEHYLTLQSLEQADRGILGRLWTEQVILPRLLREQRVDVLFSPANTMPMGADCPTVVTFQNAAPFCSNITFQTVGLSAWLRFRLLRRFISISAKNATRIIFISRFFRKLLNEQMYLPEEKGVVIYRARGEVTPPVSDGLLILDQYEIRQPFVLCVSHLYPYKNILELVQAHLALTASGQIDAQLVVAGGSLLSSYETKISRFLHRYSVNKNNVNLIGAVPHNHVAQLLRSAAAFAFPSTCENCPTSLIEALAAGLPIICSNIGVMPEIAGSAAQYFDPFDVEDIARTLHKVLVDEHLRAEMSRRALVRAQDFPTPQEVASQTLSTIEDATNV